MKEQQIDFKEVVNAIFEKGLLHDCVGIAEDEDLIKLIHLATNELENRSVSHG